jgi:glutaredoxin
MDRASYNQCVASALKGQKFTKEERKREFCIASKTCSGKASSREEANQMCELSASQPKAPKTRRSRASSGGGSASGMRLVLLTTTSCKPCSSAKQYLQDRIDKGEVQVLDVQKSDFAADLVAKHKILSVPKLMLVDSEGNPFSEIQITDNEQLL